MLKDEVGGIFKTNPRIDLALQEVTGYSPEDLQAKNKKQELTTARMIGIYFYLAYGYSLNDIGLRFHRDHSTVIHARKIIETYYGQKSEQEITDLVNQMSLKTGLRPAIIKDDQPIPAFEATNKPIEIKL